MFFIYTARVICFHNATTSLTSSFLPSLFVCYMYHCVDCEQYLIAFLKSVGVTHRARCNLRSGVFFFQITEIKGEGMIASYARCAVRRETRGCQPEKPSWPSRGMCMTPLTLRKTRQYLQSNNGGFFFFLPRSPVVSHAMSNLDFSTMEDWLTAFMV